MTGLDPESRRILELAREARTPSDRDRARFEQRFALALGSSAAAGSGTTVAEATKAAGTAKSAGTVVALKWWIGGGALLAVVAAGHLLRETSTPRARTPFVQARALPAAPTIAPASVNAASPSPVAEQPTAQPGVERKPDVRHVERRRHGAEPASLSAEIELLHDAQAAWRAHDASRALLLLREHGQRFPRSELRLERDALQVLTLCELGRKDDAGRIARAFLAGAPHSPLRASVEESCASK